MNERIQKLADEAYLSYLGLGPIATIGNWGRVEWKDNVYPQLGDKLYAAIDLQKFAELIVRECADIADEPTSRPFDSYGKKIKEHFGVPE